MKVYNYYLSKKDFNKMKKYFHKACDLNDGNGCSNLGVFLLEKRW